MFLVTNHLLLSRGIASPRQREQLGLCGLISWTAGTPPPQSGFREGLVSDTETDDSEGLR